jgi:hypothetical protein
MAFDGDVQPPRLALPQPPELVLERGDLGQDLLGQLQKPHARRRQLQGLRPPHEQLHPHLLLEPLDLMRQRRLRDVQLVRRPRQPAGVVDRLDRLQMPELDMHVAPRS